MYTQRTPAYSREPEEIQQEQVKAMQNTGIIENNRTQMRRGVLEYSILLILASGDEYASSIIQKLKDVNIIVVEGTTYPLLTRLKNMGLLNYRWEESPQGPPRKYYSITDLGRQQLAGLDAAWTELSSAIDSIRKNSIVNK
jgi:PadR family transcriptional regulator PadR